MKEGRLAAASVAPSLAGFIVPVVVSLPVQVFEIFIRNKDFFFVVIFLNFYA